MPPKKITGSQLLAELGNSLERVPPAPSAPTATIGRPSKVGQKGESWTVRVSADQAEALRRAALARSQASGGRILATPQDILRILIDRAMADPAFPDSIIEDPS